LLKKAEETKTWMAIGSGDKSALMTYPQLLSFIDQCWKTNFIDVVRDKVLIQEARAISYLRNTICHMTDISDEEIVITCITLESAKAFEPIDFSNGSVAKIY
jgi:hypothetical protein